MIDLIWLVQNENQADGSEHFYDRAVPQTNLTLSIALEID